MKITIAALAACFAAASLAAPAMADNLVIQVAPQHAKEREAHHRHVQRVEKRVIVRPPVHRKVVVRQDCYYKTVKKTYNHKTVVTKTRVCR